MILFAEVNLALFVVSGVIFQSLVDEPIKHFFGIGGRAKFY